MSAWKSRKKFESIIIIKWYARIITTVHFFKLDKLSLRPLAEQKGVVSCGWEVLTLQVAISQLIRCFHAIQQLFLR